MSNHFIMFGNFKVMGRGNAEVGTNEGRGVTASCLHKCPATRLHMLAKIPPYHRTCATQLPVRPFCQFLCLSYALAYTFLECNCLTYKHVHEGRKCFVTVMVN